MRAAMAPIPGQRPPGPIRRVVGLALALTALVAGCWGLYHAVRTGTCGSGGPYVSARPCPQDTGLYILALVGGIFAMIIAVPIYGSSRRPGRLGLGLVMWILGFTLAGGTALFAAFGPAASGRSDSELGAAIVAAVLIPMGVAPLLAVPFLWGRPRASSSASGSGFSGFGGAGAASGPPGGGWPQAPSPPPPPPLPGRGSGGAQPSERPVGDALDRLRRLGELRAAGVLSEAEFEAQKERLLKEI